MDAEKAKSVSRLEAEKLYVQVKLRLEKHRLINEAKLLEDFELEDILDKLKIECGMEKLKRCTMCGEEKSADTKYFSVDIVGKDGLKSRCKTCCNKWKKEYRKKNKNKIKEYNKEYFKKYYKENKEIREEYLKEYRKENKEYIKQYNQEYRKENKEHIRQYNQTKRSLEKQLPATLTIEQWHIIKLEFNNKCAYCAKECDLEQEHFIPISKGGGYTKNNIIPACKSCNTSKNSQDFEEWYPTYKHYSEEREKYILDYLKSRTQ